jgi:hypothetical protein
VEEQNVTLVLPKKLLREVKRIAIERGTSMSALMVEALEKLVPNDDAYEQAYQHWRKLIQHPRDRGLKGKIPWTRDELHERR